MEKEFTGTVTPQMLAEQIVELLDLCFDKDKDVSLALKLAQDKAKELEEYEPPDASMPIVEAKSTVTPVPYKPDIFQYSRLNPDIQVECDAAWKSTLQRCQKKLKTALDDCGSEQHQLYLVHRVLTRGIKRGIGLGLGLMTSRIAADEAAARKTVLWIVDFLHSGHVLGQNTNDALTFQNMAFVLMSHPAPEDNATDEEWDAHDKLMAAQACLFDLSDAAKGRLAEMSRIRHDIMAGRKTDIIQVFKRRSTSLVNDENKAVVKNWVECGTDAVTPSPNICDTRAVKDADGIVTHREPVYLYKKGKGYLYAAFKKPVAEGGCRIALDEDGEVLIGRSTFEKLLPANLRPMTESHKQICGCKEHENMQFKHEAPDGQHIWPTPNEAYLSMTCNKPVGDQDWMVPYKCTLGHCDDCPKLKRAPGEDIKTTGNRSNKGSYKEVCTEYRCEKHGFISGYKSICHACDAAGTPKGQRPKVTNKEAEVWRSCSIGEFMDKVYPAQLRAYSHHRFLCNVFGKRGCLGQREAMAMDKAVCFATGITQPEYQCSSIMPLWGLE